MDVHANRLLCRGTLVLGLTLLVAAAEAAVNIASEPLYLGGSAAPLNMLVLGRDHTLYYEAYNDASDLDGDGVLDTTYHPDAIDYFGYFDSYKCYRYDSGQGRFEPASRAPDKTCSGQWSGDFLNYLTTSRIDALRKVLYGGSRHVDQDDLVVLERSYIPQDAHSWGKEYAGLAQEGYDIRAYAPLELPAAGTRHLFANTTLLKTGNKEPRLRVLTHSTYRIWEWVAIERPVAGSQCEDSSGRRSCEDSGSNSCEIVPDMQLTQETYRITRTGKQTGDRYPRNEKDYNVLEAWNAKPSNFCGARAVTEIDGSGNPFAGVNGCSNERYLTLFTGTLDVDTAGYYTFAVDGDDAVELAIDGEVVAAWYGGHGRCGNDNCRCNGHTGEVFLLPGEHQVRFRHQEWAGGDNYYLRWWRYRPPSVMTDYSVRVQVCDPAVGLESNCRVYPAGSYKPTGLLQKHGEDDQMLFGLISGSYSHPYNMQGGVLRKNMGSITDEIDLDTGAFTDTVGIIRSIDRMRVVDFNMGQNYQYNGGWLTTEPMSGSSREFPDWGNPIAEMLYEGVRYFAGKQSPTPDFVPPASNGMEAVTLRDYAGDNTMELPLPSWTDPLDEADSSTAWCSAGALLVISDLNPSYDTDQVPGSAFSSFTGDVTGLDCSLEADAIWTAEHGNVTRQHFIGQVGDDYDGAPSEKTVSGLGDIRGLAPEAPTKEGGYYSAAVSKFAYETDLRPDLIGRQNLNTVAVALASPLPKIEIPVAGTTVTVVPFAKSVDGYSIDRDRGAFQPTNTIVDFFVDTFANTDPEGSDADPDVNAGRPYVRFRINFEDVEQGADHDMDAIIVYELRANADGTLTVSLLSEYAAGSIEHHLGYVISGTTADGVYLEVRDEDTSESSDVAYFLDTPAGLAPGACELGGPDACDDPLPLTATRTFTPSGIATGATVLNSPLWYAAKYGTADPDDLDEGETSSNYFLVTNATNLEKQLDNAFYEILGLISSASAAATNSTLLRDDTLVYQARFDPDDWSGEIRAMEVNPDGSLGGMRWNTNEVGVFAPHSSRRVYTYNGQDGLTLTWDEWSRLSLTQCAGLLGIALEDAMNLLGIDDPGAAGCSDLEPLAPDHEALDLSLARARLEWLRGDDSEELTGVLRGRNRLLGDIVHSNPFLVDTKEYGFEVLARQGPESSYDSFRDGLLTAGDNGEPRRPVLYVGANDGMLHGFDGNEGEEVFAYMPHAVFTRIAALTEPEYEHRYYVDGSPWAVDAYIDPGTGTPAWRTVLVGTTGAGARAVFALDVTDPETFGPEQVLWEMTDDELGYTIGQATIARLEAGDRWVALVGNGYNSASQHAQLFVIDLSTGDIIRRLDTGVGDGDSPNGLASPTPVDVDYDRITDYVYAGDLQGNLWKFDFTGASADDWSVAFSGTPLFTATDQALAGQPITHRPAVARHPRGGVLVLFGTGKFFSEDDNVVDMSTQTQSFYGIWDQGVPVGARAGSLLEQTILYQGPPGDADLRNEVRLTSNEPIDWTTHDGWFMDLSFAGAREGERVIDPPIMRTDRIVFTTLIPNDDECASGGNSWLMELDFQTGARLAYSAFDLNDDERFNLDDFIVFKVPSEDNPGETLDVSVPAAGVFIPAIAKAPAFITIGYKDVKYSSLSSGLLLDVDNRADLGSGRQSWRQLR
ncbi:PilC/PilY family type IV pilus protein [uncultured Thiohalocapsa sp.]|uniref:PilC/PilY family type IV pilus protein n=1 Tax=uncultured Thiohalocapsa sp. TaxID=768990 RepID=UPI0025FC3E1E|nr:PilC/PilY family type IV pilus protein [uncultured Thiohalocapsa sp.]